MNATLLALLPSVGIFAACLLLPPLIGVLTEGVLYQLDAKKAGRTVPSLLAPFQEYVVNLRLPLTAVPNEQTTCILLSMAFQLLAIVMMGLQRELPPILLLQAFGVLALIMAGMSKTVPYSHLTINHALRAFLTSQPLLMLVAAGIFFATGNFNLGGIKDYPRLLVVDLPFLFIVLILVELAARTAAKEEAASDPMLAFVKLANCYRSGTLLLLAGFFFAHSIAAAALAAIVLYAILRGAPHAWPRAAGWLKAEWSWGFLYFVCGLNLIWLYIKYWM